MIVALIRRFSFLTLGIVAIGLSSPATAQNQRPGYLFLEAVKKGENQTVIDMLAASANRLVTTRDVSNNDTVLHIVTRREDLEYLRYMVQKGADVNATNTAGESPMSIAVGRDWIEGVDYLIRTKARIDITNETGETPLIQAVHRRSTDMMELLLKAGADPDRNDNSGRSARDYAELDSRNSRVLAVIEEHEKPNTESQAYGPGA